MMILTSELAPEILEAVQSEVFSVWFLIGAALVFFMQCGFAMVEAGFTRAKNTANIIMKNLIDFCLGTVAFFLLGYNLWKIYSIVFGRNYSKIYVKSHPNMI